MAFSSVIYRLNGSLSEKVIKEEKSKKKKKKYTKRFRLVNIMNFAFGSPQWLRGEFDQLPLNKQPQNLKSKLIWVMPIFNPPVVQLFHHSHDCTLPMSIPTIGVQVRQPEPRQQLRTSPSSGTSAYHCTN